MPHSARPPLRGNFGQSNDINAESESESQSRGRSYSIHATRHTMNSATKALSACEASYGLRFENVGIGAANSFTSKLVRAVKDHDLDLREILSRYLIFIFWVI